MFFRISITLALAFAAAPLLAQAVVQPIGVSDADALAEQVRRLGANPLDLDALLTAAELSLRLDDLSAAGSFLARADKIAPGSARGAAIRGAILVRSERPGEALRQFAQAEAMGLPPARFAADRGLAYDLIGDQPRAQREYRLALREAGGDDETRRRYALSFAISGKQREALDELAPLVRRNDRAAWRTRAFVLAMGGDAAEASRIAGTMMPPGSAQGLKAFFAELPGLPAIDRAFAVHFGEVRPNPSRLADARLAPPLAPLPAEPAPVQVAAVATPAPASMSARERNKRKPEKLKPGRVAITYTPMEAAGPGVAALEPASQPPAYQPPAYQPAVTQPPAYRPPATVVTANTVDRPLTPGEQASLAAATLRPDQRRGGRSVTLAAATPAAMTSPGRTKAISGDLPPATSGLATPPAARPTTAQLTPRQPVLLIATGAPNAAPVAAALGITPPEAGRGAAVPTAAPPTAATSTPIAALVTPVTLPAVRPTAATPVQHPGRTTRTRSDDILAKIVANLSIPASELGVGGRPSRVGEQPVVESKTPAERKAEAKKALAEKKATAERKAAAAEEAAAKKAARAEPSRIWVQVAGGANERDLGKAWSAARGKAPDAFAGRKGYTAKLRATNRVLTGPFKTDAEARTYVNQLRKNGIAAFAFTSEAGEKVSRLSAE